MRLLLLTLLPSFGLALSLSAGGAHLTTAQRAFLKATASKLASPGKGLTACDEGPATIGARFEAVGVKNSEEARRVYRNMLFTAEGVSDTLSGAILDPETLYQKDDAGVAFPSVLASRDILVGVKPHLKVYALPGCGGDTVMQGLDSLAVRAQEYALAGATFAKWRSPLEIDTATGRPTDLAIKTNMGDLARYALICQANGLMPIVEPDVSLTGDHTLEEAVDVNIRVQAELYKAMIDHGVYMEGATLKPNIVNPGRSCSRSYSVEEIAEANIYVLRNAFPVAMPGLNFLSGGQSLQDAAARLSAINKAEGPSPWNISFSWSQALQLPLLQLCKDSGELQLEAMSKLYSEELKIASAAALGKHAWEQGEGDHVGVAPPAPPAPPPSEAPPAPSDNNFFSKLFK